MGGGGERLHVSREPVLRRMSSALLTFAVLIAGFMLTWVAARAAIDSEKQQARAELQLLTADIQSAIGDRLLAYEALLRAGVGLLDAFWPVAERQLAALRAPRCGSPPSIQVSRASGLRRVDESGQPTSKIVFLEPLDASNRLALGFDMMSEPRRRAAMERARDSGCAGAVGQDRPRPGPAARAAHGRIPAVPAGLFVADPARDRPRATRVAAGVRVQPVPGRGFLPHGAGRPCQQRVRGSVRRRRAERGHAAVSGRYGCARRLDGRHAAPAAGGSSLDAPRFDGRNALRRWRAARSPGSCSAVFRPRCCLRAWRTRSH